MAVLEYNSSQQLTLHGVDLSARLSSGWQEPVYVYSLPVIQERIDLYKKVFAGKFRASLHYAMKANAHPEILKLMKKNGLGADVVSGGELKKARAAGIEAKHILFSGVGKSVKELEFAVIEQIYQINVESVNELKRLSEVTQKLKQKISVGLRVNPAVDAKTHPYISTGFRNNKFGIDEAQIAECLKTVKESGGRIELKALTCHIGSMLTEFSATREALRKIRKMYQEISAQGFPLERLDVGGGVGIHYQRPAETDLEIFADYSKVLHEELDGFGGEVMAEPGRFLVARAGLLLTQIQYVKTTPYKTFVICNSGMNHLIRPALYQAHHRVLPLLKRVGEMTVDVVGPICESSDFFAQERVISRVEEGDWLAICDAGAYGASMLSLYNAFEPPKEMILTF